MLKKTARIKAQDKDLTTVQDNVVSSLDGITSTPFLGGNLLSGITLVAGQINEVKHLLGRKIEGWFIVDSNAQATIWRDSATNSLAHLTVNLRTSANVTVNIWVF